MASMKSSTMNISMPEPLKAFVEAQVAERHYSGVSEYMRELVRRDQMEKQQIEQDRQAIHDLLTEGIQSPVTGEANAEYFAMLRARAKARRAGKGSDDQDMPRGRIPE